MSDALDAIRVRHFPDPVYEPGGPLGHKNAPECITCNQKPPCDAAQLLAALDRAEAVGEDLTVENKQMKLHLLAHGCKLVSGEDALDSGDPVDWRLGRTLDD